MRFSVYKLDRNTFAGVFRSPSGIMPGHPFFDIFRNAGIQGPIGTGNDVDKPGRLFVGRHGGSIAIFKGHLSILGAGMDCGGRAQLDYHHAERGGP